ncbi:hypothetical protein [Streptomyces botrytidirepellens]|nr:hypothetical protein [Streptomyces botrytidirepellens]
MLYLDPGWDAPDAPRDTAQDATPDPERTAVADRGVAVLNDIARECGPE